MDATDVGIAAGGIGTGAAAMAAYQSWRAASERTVLDGKPTTLARVDANRLTQDPDTFQFKSGGDHKGVTDRLKGVKSWNPAAAGKVMVFERADGQQVIADGHQRTGLAQRLMADGHAPIKMDAIVLRERDGWSARDVRAYAAIKNMHESSGNPLDMAKVMRERPDLVTSSLPVSDAKIRDAKALANLSDPAFRMVTSGTVKPEIAAAVGESVKDTGRHVDLMTEMAKAKLDTRTLASRLGYKLNYALGALTIGGVAAAGMIAADAARNRAQAAGKSEAETNLDAIKTGAVAATVAGVAVAAIGKGMQLAARAIPKIAPYLGPVGAGVGIAYAGYGAWEGWKQTGTAKGAALGAFSGGHVFEGWRKPDAGPVRLNVPQTIAFAAASIEREKAQAAAKEDDGKRSGWSNAARIAAAQSRGVAAPYGGNPYQGPAQWAPPPPVAADTSTASIAEAMKKR